MNRAAAPEAAPDIAAAMSWLSDGPAVTERGLVHAWVEPGGCAFPYPEAGALLLRLLARQCPTHRRVPTIAAWLERCARSNRIGKAGRCYRFDEAVVLAALASFTGATVWVMRDLAERIVAGIVDDATVTPPAPARWSTVVGPHLARAVIGLRAFQARTGCPFDPSLFCLVEPDPTGRLLTPPGASTYLHAMLYGLEGLANLIELGVDVGRNRERLEVCLRWVQGIQADDGSLPAWHDGTQPHGCRPADAVAQAVRLWALLDRSRYAEPIAAGLRWLARLQHPCGAILYCEGSRHANTWATVFTVQATQMAQGQPTTAVDLY